MKKFYGVMFSPWLMGILVFILSVAMAVATFVENDFGTAVARKTVYGAKWFELIFILLIINLFGQINTFKLLKKNKLTILVFHLAFVIMILGAGITRYFGYEGMLHIREGEASSTLVTSEKFLQIDAYNQLGENIYHDSRKFFVNRHVSDKYKHSFNLNNNQVYIEFKSFIPNATHSLIESKGGKPMVSVLLMGQNVQDMVYFAEGDVKQIGMMRIGFQTNQEVDINIMHKGDSVFFKTHYVVSKMSMMNQQAQVYKDTLPLAFEFKSIYTVRGSRMVLQDYVAEAAVKPIAANALRLRTGKNALLFDVQYNGKGYEHFVWDAESAEMNSLELGGLKVDIKYGSKKLELPFEIELNDFIVERYPGSNSPSGFKSDVVLHDKANEERIPYLIYMNNILNYKGYRFYQASYDDDEMGTVLSVNRDGAGTFVTYLGYFLMTLGIILSLINPKSFFRRINTSILMGKSGKLITLLLFLIIGTSVYAQNTQPVIPKKHANEFGKVLIQDQKGRTKPIYTFASDVLRKLARQESYKGFNAVQVITGMYKNPDYWRSEPILRTSNKELQNLIGADGKYVSYNQLVDNNYGYRLLQYVEEAYSKPAGARSKFDKEVMKLDEKVNICFMLYNGQYFRIFPAGDDDKWESPDMAYMHAKSIEDSLFLKNIFGLFLEAANYNDTDATNYLEAIGNYQQKFASYELPSTNKVNLEILYLKLNVFKKLFPIYFALGLLLLVFLMVNIFKNKQVKGPLIKVGEGLIILGFALHTIGLALRWYISGHAPMSNGYESIVFISWVTLLAGILFRKRTIFALSATAILGALALMVANLSFMDPEITNLVPVLKSYWLTIHVSVITASYGFLGFGAILGIIAMLLFTFANQKNKDNLSEKILEITVLNYKTLTVGLYLLTIGTFLGAVWANESWGRYWGWDPKETWALITMMVYTFVLHARMMKKLNNVFLFNAMAIFAYFSVMMTYFGVNYYLSGLHSYAGGDPVPVPKFVFVIIVSLITLVYVAFNKGKMIFTKK